MFPAYIDPIAPGLVPAFANALRVPFAWLAAVGLLGVLAVVALVVAEVVRSRRPGSRRLLPKAA
ncbi:MAG: hypothetical protein ACREQL_07135 [Candidatus Binatia bacterium]